MPKIKSRKLVLDCGLEFPGAGYGASGNAVGEIVFNTAVEGYQEILSDPAYAGQIVVMTYPTIGHYGITDEDYESRTLALAGLVVRECCETPSNFRFTRTLPEELEEHEIPCLSGVDTRMITALVRDGRCRRAALVDAGMPLQEALALIASTPEPRDLVARTSCAKRWFSRTPHHSFDVVAVDCGLKHSVITALNDRGCNVTVVPFDTPVEDVLAFKPDGVLVSGGPGSPADLPQVVSLVRALRGRLPLAGVSLGHLLVASAFGARVERLPHGHHGGRAVRAAESGRIFMTEQNHGWAVDAASLPGTGLEITHTDVQDGSVEGLRCTAEKVFSVQYYPEGAPGPRDGISFYDDFVTLMSQ
ncbi:MAG: glutamine-hydrolyzing carbamoyl-phosphate synthase small subunit [Bacteroidales bacterium]|nr:glutamine-hydrolyzing carbamoyl-phosphate synthase small subunit [Bacteroidales bacterium]